MVFLAPTTLMVKIQVSRKENMEQELETHGGELAVC